MDDLGRNLHGSDLHSQRVPKNQNLSAPMRIKIICLLPVLKLEPKNLRELPMVELSFQHTHNVHMLHLHETTQPDLLQGHIKTPDVPARDLHGGEGRV